MERKFSIIHVLLNALREESEVYLYNQNEFIISLTKSFSVKELSDFLSVSYRTAGHYKRGQRPVSFSSFSKLVKYSGLEAEKQVIQLNKLQVGCNSGSRNKKNFLPLRLSKDLLYVTGYLYGDGCLYSKKFSISFVDEYETQILEVAKKIESLFKCNYKIYTNESKSELRIYSKPICLFFNRVFEMPIGEKYSRLKVPNIVYRLPNSLKAEFLKGVMDADGGILRVEDYEQIPSWFVNSPQIDLAQKSKFFIGQIKGLFLNFGIKATGPYYNKNNKCYKVVISGKKQLKRYHKLQLFSHSMKKWRLNQLFNASVAQW